MAENVKIDGRKTIKSSGSFSYRLREATRKRIIASFLITGGSTHSRLGFTLGVIIEHCIKHNIPFKLIAYPSNGFQIERIPELGD